MARTVGIGLQNFEKIRESNNFYIDKTSFIKEWWSSNDDVTLIARPRRFGKTLNISMLEKFFSVKYAGRGDLFEGLKIWEEEKYRQMQGTYPLISFSFANWSLLLASGYLKVLSVEMDTQSFWAEEPMYELTVTNKEVKRMFLRMVRGWFAETDSDYDDFVTAMLQGDVEAMNVYMNRVTRDLFSYFDTGKRPSEEEPERFYHGFVLGLMVQLGAEYILTSNRESGFGRYDVMLEPRKADRDAIILEFKVFNPNREKSLEDTVAAALKQIEEKQYEAALLARGFEKEQIRKYGFAFEGKKVLIG